MSAVQPLRRRAAFSVAWSTVRFGGDQLFNIIVFAVLARLLTPAEFGVFVISLVFAEAGKILAQAGLVTSLFRVRELTEELADTVFWGNLSLGIVIASIGFAVQGPIAAALGDPAASPVIGAIGFTVPIAALGASHMARNLRAFGHKALAIRSLVAGLIGGTLAIAAALAGWGVWALVVQRFVAETVNTAVAWHAFRWRPGLRFSWRVLRAQFGIGGSIALSQLLQLALARVQDLILVRMLGLAEVGVYRTGWKTVELIAQGVITPFSTVAVPALAKLQHDMTQLANGYLKMVGTSALLSFPAIVGVGVLADQIIPLVYGPRWSASIPVAQVLAFLVLPFALNFFSDPVMLVLGRTKSILFLTVVQLGGTLILCIAAAPYGLVAVAGVYVLRAYLTMLLQLWLVRRAAGIRIKAVFGSVAPQLTASLVMGAVLFGSRWLLPERSGTTADAILVLALSIMTGAAVYAAVLLPALGATRRRVLVRDIREVIGRGKAVPAP